MPGHRKGVLECEFLKSSAAEDTGKEPYRVAMVADSCASGKGAPRLALELADKFSQSDVGIR